MGGLKLLFFSMLMAWFLCAHKVHSSSGDMPVRIAVAANFKPTLQNLAKAYLAQNPQANVQISSASSGVLYAQVLRGAPFDLFLSADSERPEMLQQQGLVETDSLISYALGQLVLWAPGLTELNSDKVKAFSGNIALANPKLAPFGRASIQTLEKLGLWDSERNKLIMANNVSQVAQMVSIGAVPMGLLSKSLIKTADKKNVWQVPDTYYQAIVQQMVILNTLEVSEQHRQRVRSFYHYILSPQGKNIISQNGYLLPSVSSTVENFADGR